MKLNALSGLLVFSLAVALSSASTWAEGKKGLVDSFSGAGYGLAGCGLGSIVFGAKPGMVQIFAATTNGIYGNQTFAISLGTSNCDIPRMGQQAAAFIEVNKETVLKEAAMGQGESVDAISTLLNCSKPAVRSELKSQFDHYLGEGINSYETVRRLIKSGLCTVEG